MRIVMALTLSGLLLCGCQEKKAIPQPSQAVQVQAVKPEADDAADSRYSAVVLPETQVTVAFRVPGYVRSLLQVRGEDGVLRDLAEGDRVAKGAVLAQLRTAEYDDKLHQTSGQAEAGAAAAAKAQLDYARAARLYASQSLTKPEMDSATAQRDATQAQVRAAMALKAEAEVALRDTKLRAPLSGDVLKKLVEAGSLAGAGTPAFVVAKTDKVKILIGVSDLVLPSLKLGMAVNASTEALPGRELQARITRISAAADSKAHTFEVEVAIPNPDHSLKPGMIATVVLQAKAREQELAGIVVPLQSVVELPDGRSGVFIAIQEASGTVARFRAVELGELVGKGIAVKQGLVTGEMIVTTGANVVKDGQRVEVLK